MEIDKNKLRVIKKWIFEALLLSIIYSLISYLLVEQEIVDPDEIIAVSLGMPGLAMALSITFGINYPWFLFYFFVPLWIIFFLLLGIINRVMNMIRRKNLNI